MEKKESRRYFLKKMTSAGLVSLAIPYMKVEAKSRSARSDRLPIILCSRGEYWGKKINAPGWDILAADGKALDAVEKSTNVAELDPEDISVGYGGLPNELGIVQLDASIMDGSTHKCGAVGALEFIKTPSSVARLVMQRTNHVMLVGQGALDFALAHGFDKENLLTDRARIEWLRWKENLNDTDDWLPPPDGIYKQPDRITGTINVLAVDGRGEIAGVTSTSGIAYKIPGRIGDSPIIGAGLYVDNEVGASGATGRGEEVIRSCGCFLIVELMRQGLSPQKACEEACLRIISINEGNEKVRQQLGFNVKFCALNKSGDVGCASIRPENQKAPEISLIDSTGFHVYSGTYIIA